MTTSITRTSGRSCGRSTNSVKGFTEAGCAVACHVGEGKPYGNKYTMTEGEVLDMWHMKGMRTGPVGHVDDQYTDHTRYSKQKSPNAGRKGDPVVRSTAS